eukprot:7802166-Lingulodinium_polyedra.AAC.1
MPARWEAALDKEQHAVTRRAYVDGLTFWERRASSAVAGDVAKALAATRRLDLAMDWGRNDSKNRQRANAAALRK